MVCDAIYEFFTTAYLAPDCNSSNLFILPKVANP